MFSRIIALFLLIFLAPIFIIVGFLILLEDGFPILFVQKRIGKHGNEFWIFKFRSMKKNTPNLATDLLGDPSNYLLKIGQIIRKLSIDELPNLLNIIKGEMSFIGPRPALYNQTDLIVKRKHAGIDKLKPGITGWAQVNGRDELTDEQKVRYDFEYLENHSLKMDLKILYFTFLNVISSRGVSH